MQIQTNSTPLSGRFKTHDASIFWGYDALNMQRLRLRNVPLQDKIVAGTRKGIAPRDWENIYNSAFVLRALPKAFHDASIVKFLDRASFN